MQLGNRILHLLYENDITQKQLAVDLNIAPSTLSGYINNRREPDYGTLLKIANRFQVSCDYLMGNSSKEYHMNVDVTINRDDLHLLKYYRKLDETQKNMIMDLLKVLCQQKSRQTKKT